MGSGFGSKVNSLFGRDDCRFDFPFRLPDHHVEETFSQGQIIIVC